MRFNDDNIEAWMLDYFEGRLDKATANALKDEVLPKAFRGSWPSSSRHVCF